MIKIFLGIFLLLLGIAGGLYGYNSSKNQVVFPKATTSSPSQTTKEQPSQTERVTVIAEYLDTPWAIGFLPDGSMLVTERKGTIRLIDKNGTLNQNPVATISEAKEIGEGGLLGIVIDPEFEKNNYIYLYYTYSASGNNTLNRVVRMLYTNNLLSSETILFNQIPGAANHNGGRIAFGPDGYLYVTTGDAQEPSHSQNRANPAGKILRMAKDGKPAAGNPFNNLIYSYGHRNPQGLAWGPDKKLWATEHGRSGIQSGLDEINLIEPGKNYGWPTIEGSKTQSDMVTPVRNSGNTTWAPAGAAFIGNSLFFGGLRGQTLYEAVLKNNQVLEIKEHFADELGRIREVIKGPDDMLYISTSNRDSRGTPQASDDKILRIDPSQL